MTFWYCVKNSPNKSVDVPNGQNKKKKLFLCYLRAFTSACAKNSIYLSIKTYFFYFTYSLFKTLHIRLSILHYITLKYLFFLNFLIVSLSSHIITTIHSLHLDFSLGIHKEVIKIYICKVNNVNINLQCSNFAYKLIQLL